jgi:hypothetical protein
MTARVRLTTAIAGAVAGVVTVVAPALDAQGLRGDAEAVRLARAMVERLGGRERWAAASTLHVVEEVHRPAEAAPYRSELWRWLRAPRIRGTSRRADGEHTFAYSPSAAWRLDAGVVTHLHDVERRQWVSAWPRNVYVVYARLAREDSTLWLASAGARRFALWDWASGVRLCEFEVSASGEPVRWTSPFGGAPEAWIYGPLVDFGPIRMPAWGVRLEDAYRFFYRAVTLSDSVPRVSLDPPRR